MAAESTSLAATTNVNLYKFVVIILTFILEDL